MQKKQWDSQFASASLVLSDAKPGARKGKIDATNALSLEVKLQLVLLVVLLLLKLLS